jgi:malate dehydrogenase
MPDLTPHIAIIGAGEIGGAAAEALARLELAREIRLIDPAADVAAGKALDIMQAAPIEAYTCRVAGTADTHAAVGSAAIVIADFAAASGRPAREPRGDEGLELLRRLWTVISADETPIVCAGATHGPLVRSAIHELKIDRRRLIGSAPAAFEAAARALTALALDGAGRDVNLLVVGVPPDSIVPCWSQASVGGVLLTSRLNAAQIARIDARLPKLWPPGPYALGSAAAAAVRGIVERSRGELTCFVGVDGEMRLGRRVVALPVRLGAAGVSSIGEPQLSPRELTALGA